MVDVGTISEASLLAMSSKGKQLADGRNLKYNASPSNRYFDAYTSVLSLKFLLILLGVSTFIVSVYIQIAINLSGKFNQKSLAASDYHFDGQSNCLPYAYNLNNPNNETGNKVLIVADNLDAGYLDHVIETFQFNGFDLTIAQSFDNLTSSSKEQVREEAFSELKKDQNKHEKINLEQFNVIWAYDYPFASIKNLMPTQRVNHFPGVGFIANKVTLSTTPKLPNTLRAFRLPEESEKFVEYSSANPGKEWVEKTSSHRGISITSANKVNLAPLQSSIVQHFVSNPLLIDGKKFDIGIYVAITSVNPLRAYLYDEETLIRFCSKPYYHDNHASSGKKSFNASDIDSYVVGDDYTPIWLMPSLLKYYIGTNLSMKKTLKTYLKEHQVDNPETIWQQIETTIKHVLKEKEIQVAKLVKLYQQSSNSSSTSSKGSLNQFFELLRFDFIIDDSLNVYLMEANMSPNLSSKHFPPNKFIYEQVLRSYFSLIGLTEFSARHLLTTESDNSQSARRKLDKIIDDKELSVYEELCSSHECHMNCSKQDCQICYFCLTNSDKLQLKRAIYEHKSKWNFKRLLPSTQQEDFALQLNNLQLDTEQNLIHVQWFKGKCYSDQSYCN